MSATNRIPNFIFKIILLKIAKKYKLFKNKSNNIFY